MYAKKYCSSANLAEPSAFPLVFDECQIIRTDSPALETPKPHEPNNLT